MNRRLTSRACLSCASPRPSDAAEEVVARNVDAVEGQQPVLAAPAAHRLRQRGDRQAGRVALDEQRRQLPTAFLPGPRDNNEVAGEVRVGDQPLATVDDVVAAVAAGGSADVGAGATVRLGQGESDR